MLLLRSSWLVLTLVASAAPALAHDLWLVPPARAERGAPLELALAVGMDFPTSVAGIDPARVTMRLRRPGESADAPLRIDVARAGETLSVARWVPDAAGLWIASAVTRPNVLAQEAADFNDYLLHDGLAHVLAQRMQQGRLDEPARERYSKHTKALFAVGGESAGAFDVPLGLELELVPLANPLAVAVGGALPVRVLFRGAPLERANVCWDHPGNGAAFSGETRTDAEGRALVPVARSGPMTLRLVHMTEPVGEEVNWESFWSSLTFHVAADG